MLKEDLKICGLQIKEAPLSWYIWQEATASKRNL